MDALYNYFKELNKSPKINEEINKWLKMKLLTTHIPNHYITQDKIKRCIKNLKNNRCCPDYGIKNEYIKYTQSSLVLIYHSTFA
jgi:hypothetical protein